MAETKIYIDDNVDKKLREEAMARFGYGRGSISSAVEEAIVQWLRRDGIIRKRLDAIVDMAKKDNGVIAVLLFGSYARKEHDYVDVDVALLLEKDAASSDERLSYSNAEGGYEDHLVDLSILNKMPLDAQSKILNEAEILYVRDKAKLYDYSIDVIGRWSDFKPRLEATLNLNR